MCHNERLFSSQLAAELTPSRLLSTSTIPHPNPLSHDPTLYRAVLMMSVIFPLGDQEQEPALHFDPTVYALVLALMLTRQFARRVPGIAKPATESLKS
jgi:hypothetical protein